MAEELRINVVADDKASRTLDSISKKTDKLEGKDVEIAVNANVKGVIGALDKVAAEAKDAAEAADVLGQALGPELAAKADTREIVSDLQKMGLTLDEIKGNADELGGKLKELSSADVGGKLGASLGTARGQIEQLGESARSSKAVLANMVGNSVQDLGQLGGLAGSAGVAIGQMGEYMADAAASGEGLGSIVTNFAAVAGPLAALSVAVYGISTAIDAYKQQAAVAAKVKAFNTENAAEFVQLAREGTDLVEGLVEKARQDTKIEVAPNADEQTQAVMSLAQAGENLYDVIQRIDAAPGPDFDMHKADEGVENINDLLLRANENARSFFEAAADTKKFDEFVAAIKKSNLPLAEQAELIAAVIYQRDAYATGTSSITKDEKLFGLAVEDTTAALKRIAKASKPISDMPRQWKLATDAAHNTSLGIALTAEQTAAVDELTKAYGITADEVLNRGADLWDKNAQAAADAAEQVRQNAQDARDFAVSIGTAEAALVDMNSTFNRIGRRQDALSNIFKLGDAPLDALAATHTIDDAIRDLHKFIKKEGVPNIFDPNSIDATPFLAKFDTLKGEVEAKITDAFAAGGPAAATQTADAYVKQIVASLNGALTPVQVRTLLGLDDLQVKLKVAVDQASLAEAQTILGILTGLTGQTPWTAQVSLDLAAGKITPDAAKILLAKQLGDLSVNVSSELLPPPGASTDAATKEAAAYSAQHPAEMATKALAPGAQSLVDARKAGNDFAALHPILWPIEVVMRPLGEHSDGGTVGPSGGIAGEDGPEIVRLPTGRRGIVAGATFVPPGTVVTSTAQTAKQLSLVSNTPTTTTINNNTTIVNVPRGYRELDAAAAAARVARRSGRLYAPTA